MITIILPYDRRSLIHIPRRNIVLSSGDSITLRVTIIESDDPNAMLLEVSGGIGGPMVHLRVWAPDSHGGVSDWGYWCDYSRPFSAGGVSLLDVDGVISAAPGSFDFIVPAGTMAAWPRRCFWSISLNFDGGNKSEALADGTLQVRRSGVNPATTSIAILTDDGVPITGGDLTPLDA